MASNLKETQTQTIPKCPVHTTGGNGEHTGVFVPPRFQQGPITTALNLGPLAPLAGSWRGGGFNVIWRPDNPESQPLGSMTKRFLELNLTSETLDFHVIPGVVPNRGLNPQTDLSLYGLHYLQRVTDADPPPFSTAGQALHIEPGLFMNVPASKDTCNKASIVRMASIPHGVAVLMQGPLEGTEVKPVPPTIPPIYPIAGLPTFTPPSGALGLGIQPVNVPTPPPPPPMPPPPGRARGPGGRHNHGRSRLAEQRPVPSIFPGLYQRSQPRVEGCDGRPGDPRHFDDQTFHDRRRQRDREHPVPGAREPVRAGRSRRPR
jgi:hypothetical protein